jgi:hypothetical protein
MHICLEFEFEILFFLSYFNARYTWIKFSHKDPSLENSLITTFWVGSSGGADRSRNSSD